MPRSSFLYKPLYIAQRFAFIQRYFLNFLVLLETLTESVVSRFCTVAGKQAKSGINSGKKSTHSF